MVIIHRFIPTLTLMRCEVWHRGPKHIHVRFYVVIMGRIIEQKGNMEEKQTHQMLSHLFPHT